MLEERLMDIKHRWWVRRLRNALSRLECAADPFLADQSRAEDPRCGLVQPVSVAQAEALNQAVKEAREALKETEGE